MVLWIKFGCKSTEAVFNRKNNEFNGENNEFIAYIKSNSALVSTESDGNTTFHQSNDSSMKEGLSLCL